MKICPQCQRTYSDDSLRFCLDDGAILAFDTSATLPYGPTTQGAPPPPPQVAFSPDRQPRRAPRYPNRSPEDPVQIVAAANPSSPILTVGVILIAGLLSILAIVGIVFVYKYWKASESATLPGSTASPTPLREAGATDPLTPSASGALQIRATASSIRYAVQANTYNPANTVDGNKRTAWIEGVDGPGIGEWLRFDFGREINLHRIVILPGYFKSQQIWAQNNRLAAITLQFSDGSSNQFTFSDTMDRQTVDMGSVKTRWVRLIIDGVFPGTDPDTAISEVTFEWEP